MEDARSQRLHGRAIDEEALEVERARARDPVTWSRWFDEYHSPLFRYAAVRLGDREEAADVASQVFLEAMGAIDRYSYRGRPVLAWLYGIASNLVAARLRAARRTLPQEWLPDAGLDTTDGHLESMALQAALLDLSDDQREVVLLTAVLGLRAKEAASILGKKVATVYSLQARGMANLRRKLRDPK